MSRTLKVALVALGLSVFPVSYALADSPAEQKAGKAEAAKKNFPMAGAEFMEKLEDRIEKRRDRITDRMAKHSVPAATQKEVLADFDAGAEKVRAAGKTAAKDGTVTLDEAKTVHGVVKEVKKELRKEHGKGNGGGKGKKGKDGKGKEGKGKKGKGQPA
ncbi:MAG: hypothetical protein IPM79_31715 [Polyangiaceae bacterium]|jgi:hypothetical protein|nr:hypothetical protein [Polyangiaceae bacterium]MBK8942051.1 hypothetical protein [Polyangiaceae bacterium]